MIRRRVSSPLPPPRALPLTRSLVCPSLSPSPFALSDCFAALAARSRHQLRGRTNRRDGEIDAGGLQRARRHPRPRISRHDPMSPLSEVLSLAGAGGSHIAITVRATRSANRRRDGGRGRSPIGRAHLATWATSAGGHARPGPGALFYHPCRPTRARVLRTRKSGRIALSPRRCATRPLLPPFNRDLKATALFPSD